MIKKEEFWEILSDRCKEPYTSGLINSISKLMPFGDRDDIMSECYVYFIENNCRRLHKIKNINGAKISITNKLRDIYRANKKKPKHIARIEDKYNDMENIVLSKLAYTDFQKRFAYFALGRIRNLSSLNLGENKDKDGRRCIIWVKTELLSIIIKTDRKYRKILGSSDFMSWVDISEEQMNLLLYVKAGEKYASLFNVDRKYFVGNKQQSRANELKVIYNKMMNIIFEEVV